MIAFLALVQATVPIPVPVTTMPPPTPPNFFAPAYSEQGLVENTSPAVNARCKLKTENDREYNLNLIQAGGRAFQQDRPHSGSVILNSPISIEIKNDQTNIFRDHRVFGTILAKFRGLKTGGIVRGYSKENSTWIEMRFFPKGAHLLGSFLVFSKAKNQFSPDPEAILEVYVGFCKTVITKQEPLSATEINELKLK